MQITSKEKKGGHPSKTYNISLHFGVLGIIKPVFCR